MFDFSILTGPTVCHLIDQNRHALIKCVEQAYLDHHQLKTVNPESYFLRFPDNTQNRIIALPAALLGDTTVAGIKWISSFPQNIESNVPRASAVLILNDYKTGYPFACIEASLISAARTAASAVLGAYWLNDKNRQVRTLGIVGSGIIARNIVNFFKADEWEIRTVQIHDLKKTSSDALENYCKKIGFNTNSDSSLEDVLSCDLVVFTTTAATPYISTAHRFSKNQIILNISLRDLPPEIILDSQNIVDDIDHCLRAETSLHLAERQVASRHFVNGSLAELIVGDITLNSDKPRIFSPFGMGILDLAVGAKLHSEAVSQKLNFPMANFFEETTRWN